MKRSSEFLNILAKGAEEALKEQRRVARMNKTRAMSNYIYGSSRSSSDAFTNYLTASIMAGVTDALLSKKPNATGTLGIASHVTSSGTKSSKPSRYEYQRINQETEAFTDIYKKTPLIKTALGVSLELEKLKKEEYRLRPFTESKPDKEEIRKQLEEEAKQQIKNFFWWKNKDAREDYVEENLPKEYKKRLDEWEYRKKQFDHEQARIKEEKDSEFASEYYCNRLPLDVFLTGEKEMVEVFLSNLADRFEKEIPGDFGIELNLDMENETLYVELDLPEVEEIPTKKGVVLPSGNVSIKLKTQKEIQLDYIKCICGLAFYVSGHFFNISSGIKYIQVSGYTQRTNKATGEMMDDYVYSVVFERDTFSRLAIENIDPLTAMLEFPCRIKASATGILASITPFPVPGEKGFIPGSRPQKENVES